MAEWQVVALCAMGQGRCWSGRSTRNERRVTPRSAGLAGYEGCRDLSALEEP